MSSELKLHYRSKGPLMTESRRVRAPALGAGGSIGVNAGGCSPGCYFWTHRGEVAHAVSATQVTRPNRSNDQSPSVD